MVISNGALSEMWGETLDMYIKNVVAPAKCGYFMTNFDSHSAPNGGITTAKFLKILKDIGKDDVILLQSSQYLSRFDESSGTKIIIFGHGRNKLLKHAYEKGFISELIFILLRLLDVIKRVILRLYLKY